MKNFETKFERDGMTFFVRGWEPESSPKAVIALVHGHGEHVGRYAHLGKALTESGYALVGYDVRGHGQSTGQRGHTPSYESLLDDIGAFLSMLGQKYPGLPLFLYGHSMGGNQVVNYVLRRRSALKGLIATGPWLRLAFEPPRIKVGLARFMNMLFPAFTQPSGLDTAGLSHDGNVIQQYKNDALNHDKVSARLFVNVYEAGLWALDHASELALPFLLMHGGADPITSPEGSRQFAAKAGDKVTLRIWDNLYHEIHNEPEQGEVFKVIIQWLDKISR